MKHRGRRVALAAGAVAVVVLAVALFLGWPHLVFWYRFEALGKNAQGYSEYRHRQTGIVMVLLPGGRFNMGAQNEDPNGPNYDPEAAEEEGPVHEVTLSPFMMGKYLVTKRLWLTLMRPNSPDRSDKIYPVEYVSWNDIQKFVGKTGLVLPTEAQWEYASQATTSEVDEFSGRKTPNKFGIDDIPGPFREWCEDAYDEMFYKIPEAAGLDPVSLAGSGKKVCRGGAYASSPNRIGIDPAFEVKKVSFRVTYPVP